MKGLDYIRECRDCQTWFRSSKNEEKIDIPECPKCHKPMYLSPVTKSVIECIELGMYPENRKIQDPRG